MHHTRWMTITLTVAAIVCGPMVANTQISAGVTLYGITNCDTIKKARQWLELHDIDYQFHDFRAQGIEPQVISRWIEQLGWEKVVNKRSTTWKQLDSIERDNMNSQSAITAASNNPTLVKRPLLDMDGQYYVGFKPADYHTLFNA